MPLVSLNGSTQVDEHSKIVGGQQQLVALEVYTIPIIPISIDSQDTPIFTQFIIPLIMTSRHSHM